MNPFARLLSVPILALVMALGGFAAGPAQAQNLPNTPQYNTLVSLQPGMEGMTLEAALRSLALSAKLTPVMRDVPATRIRVSFTNKPFRQVFDLLVKTYGHGPNRLTYGMVNGFLLVAPESVLEGMNTPARPATPATTTPPPQPAQPAITPSPAPVPAPAPQPRQVEIYQPRSNAEEMQNLLRNLVGGLEVLYAPSTGLLIMRGTPTQLSTAKELLDKADKPLPSPAPVAPAAPPTPAALDPTQAAPAPNPQPAPQSAPQPTSTEQAKPETAPATPTTPAPAVPNAEASAQPAAPTITRFTLQIGKDNGELVKVLQALFPEGKFNYLSQTGVLVVDVPEPQKAALDKTLADIRASEPVVSTPAPTEPAPTVRLTFSVGREGAELARGLQAYFPTGKFAYLAEGGLLLAEVREADRTAVEKLMADIRANQAKPAPAAPEVPLVEVMVHLNYGKADAVADTLQKLFDEPASFSQPSQVPSPGLVPPAPTPEAANTPSSSPTRPKTPKLRVLPDARTNALVLYGTQADIDRAKRLIAGLDRQVPQVRLTVRIEQIDSNNTDNLGVDWKAVIGGLTFGVEKGAPSVGYGVDRGNPTASAGGLLSINARLNALRERGLSKTMLDNSYLVLNNQTASLNSGGELLLPTTSGSGTSASGGLQRFNFGLQVKLKPQITPNSNVQLEVTTELGNVPTSGPNGSTIIPRQTFSSAINLVNQQTVVLGGLVQNSEQTSTAGVPFLSEIPIIGELFKTRNSSNQTSHLLILITAEVLDNAAPVGLAPTPASTPAAPPSTLQNSPAAPSQAPSTPVPVTPATPAAPTQPNRSQTNVPIGGSQP